MLLKNKLDEMLSSDHANEQDVNEVFGQIESIFIQAGRKCNMVYETSTRKHTHTKPSKQWFDKNCMKARQKYHKAKGEYRKHKTDQNMTLLKTESKAYKNVLNQSRSSFGKNMNDKLRVAKLRTLKNTDSREYWKILNTPNQKSTELKIKHCSRTKKLSTNNN